MPTLTPEQRDLVLRRSAEAQAFLSSLLFQELSAWIKSEQARVIGAIIYDQRDTTTDKLDRNLFVEQMSAAFKSLPAFLEVIKEYAKQEKDIQNIDDGQDSSTRNN